MCLRQPDNCTELPKVQWGKPASNPSTRRWWEENNGRWLELCPCLQSIFIAFSNNATSRIGTRVNRVVDT